MAKTIPLPSNIKLVKTKSGDRWDARWRDLNGKQKFKRFANRDAALAFNRTLHTKLADETYVDVSVARNMTFADAFETYTNTRRNQRNTTRYNELSVMKKRVLPLLGPHRIGGIRPEHIDALVTGLEDLEFSSAYIRKLYALTAQVFAYALRRGWIAETPCRDISLPEIDTTRLVNVPHPEDVAAIVEHLDDRYGALVMLAAYSGLRWGELAGLRWENVDTRGRQVAVMETLAEAGGMALGQKTKTKASMATVAIPKPAVEALLAHKLKYRDPDTTRDLVFTSAEGLPLRRSNFRRREWMPLWAPPTDETDAGPLYGDVKPCTFHTLRHACASWMLDAGYQIHEVQKQMRHAKASITLDTYGHLMNDELDTSRMDALGARAARRKSG